MTVGGLSMKSDQLTQFVSVKLLIKFNKSFFYFDVAYLVVNIWCSKEILWIEVFMGF